MEGKGKVWEGVRDGGGERKGLDPLVPLVTRNSAIADKPARRVYRSVKVTKHSTIPYVRVSYCAIITLSLRHAVFTIFDFKNVVTLKSGSEVTRGH